jgi:hypothetical protein
MQWFSDDDWHPFTGLSASRADSKSRRSAKRETKLGSLAHNGRSKDEQP